MKPYGDHRVSYYWSSRSGILKLRVRRGEHEWHWQTVSRQSTFRAALRAAYIQARVEGWVSVLPPLQRA